MNGAGLLSIDASSQPHNCGYAYFEVLTGRLVEFGTLDDCAGVAEMNNPLQVIAGGVRGCVARLPVQYLSVDYPAAFSFGARRGNLWSLMRNHQAVGCIIEAAGLPYSAVYPFFASKYGDRAPELTKARIYNQYAITRRISEHVASAIRIGEFGLRVVRQPELLAINNLEHWLKAQAGKGKKRGQQI